MSDTVSFRWVNLGGPVAGSVPFYDAIEDRAKRYLRKPADAERWAARKLCDPKLSGPEREAFERFLYLHLNRPDGVTRLVEDDPDEPFRDPLLLERALQVSKKFARLPADQKAREHLLLEFESLLLP